jgi:hypothetical protein
VQLRALTGERHRGLVPPFPAILLATAALTSRATYALPPEPRLLIQQKDRAACSKSYHPVSWRHSLSASSGLG